MLSEKLRDYWRHGKENNGDFFEQKGVLERDIPCFVLGYYEYSDSCYPVCPACRMSMEREYQNYCDRCGQKLDWREYDFAVPICY